ncbi:MAG TPA: Gfo/Idh/MocA family oxidoreductase [Candidatus Acidoferrales bacterium]|nr:Gfo/Idh/MocA family oxidoreductase [Candidatus Acidoferrales bacterium]
MSEAIPQTRVSAARAASPRLGFAGVGWIGRHRMEAIARSGGARVVAIADPDRETAKGACKLASEAKVVSFEELLDSEIDAVVIATPSALHAEQASAALQRGLAVFCQKPLGRNEFEARRVIEQAKAADRLLGVDFSYRHLNGITKIRELIRAGELGHIYAMDLTFHNAYGPDKPWFYDARLSGGGCVMDLGIHLVDLALWILDFPPVMKVTAQLFASGKAFEAMAGAVEDYAIADLRLDGGTAVRLACSWRSHAGRDAVIEASFQGTKGGARLHNVEGSFFDFVAERLQGTRREILSKPPEDWGGRAAVDWLRRLEKSNRFDPSIEHLGKVADTLDRIYGR